MGRRSSVVVMVAWAALGGSAEAARGVRLTYFGDPATSVAIGWNSELATDSVVSYGTTPAALGQTANATMIAQAAPLGATFTAKLTGLTPGTTYYYRIGDHPPAAEPPFQFTTHAADPCAPFRFVLIGDNRADFDDIGPNAIWTDILAETMPHAPDFFVNTGDMVKNGERPLEWSNFIDASEAGWAQVPSLLTMGNHDEDADNGEGALYNQLYELPRHPGGSEDYYSIDVGPIHFVSLNTQFTNPGSTDFTTQTAWLAADLAATTQPWKIVFFHKAVYTRGNHRTGEENTGAINAAFVPLFDQYDVDFVLNGHSHDYERYAPSVGVDTSFGGTGRQLPAGGGAALPAVVPDGATGTTYMVSGGAGALTTDILGFTCLDAACTLCTGFNLSCPAEVFDKDKQATVVYDGRHNFAVFDVDGDTISVTVHATVAGNTGGGEVLDTFTMTNSKFNLTCGGATPDAGPGGGDGGTPGAIDGGGEPGGGGNGDAGDPGPGVSGDRAGGCGCRVGGGTGGAAPDPDAARAARGAGAGAAFVLLFGLVRLGVRRKRG